MDQSGYQDGCPTPHVLTGRDFAGHCVLHIAGQATLDIAISFKCECASKLIFLKRKQFKISQSVGYNWPSLVGNMGEVDPRRARAGSSMQCDVDRSSRTARRASANAWCHMLASRSVSKAILRVFPPCTQIIRLYMSVPPCREIDEHCRWSTCRPIRATTTNSAHRVQNLDDLCGSCTHDLPRRVALTGHGVVDCCAQTDMWHKVFGCGCCAQTRASEHVDAKCNFESFAEAVAPGRPPSLEQFIARILEHDKKTRGCVLMHVLCAFLRLKRRCNRPST